MSVARNLTPLLTADDLAALGDDAPFELIRGELRSVSPTKGWHGLVAGRFAAEFVVYSRSVLPGEIFIAEAGFFAERNPDTIIAPDLMFYRAERLPPREELEREFLRIPPDVALEVLSASNRPVQVAEKVRIMLGAGVRMVLVANPVDSSIAVYTADGRVQLLKADHILDGGDVLPGFRVPVAQFFA